ncbi:MAG TPA: TolC family protein [Candidatus Cloacimonadota bacterium]|jgi:outer membrane protein TolC|nr:TolC family protein [Candidatus Cloacimonadales bacterium]HPY96089.1 TolC family protein [Candidatus Cloacimonadota bacterium]HQB40743.1 TolC family protein [Candidatus Cloacimonadota bacterium]
MKSKKVHLVLFLLSCLFVSMPALSLNEAIDMAKKNNKQFLGQAEDVEMAEYLYQDVRGMLLPQISLNGSVQKSKTYLPDVTQTGFSFNNVTSESNLASTLDKLLLPGKSTEEASIAAQLKAQQVLFSGGKLINGIKVAQKYRNLQKKTYELQEEQLVFDITKAYYELVLLNEVVNIQREALDLANSHFQRVQNLNENGLVSEYDLLRADLEVSKLAPALEDIENKFVIAQTNFKRQIGELSSDDLVFDDKLEKVTVPSLTLDEAINNGLENRIELYLSDLSVEMYQVKHNAEKGNYLPNVLLTADITKFSSTKEFEIKSENFGTQYSAGIVFQIPLFTGMSNNAKIQQTKHELKKAELGNMDAKDLIKLEITNNWQSLQTAVQQLNVQEKNIKTAEKGYEIANERYENNIGIQLEILDAQTQLNGAKVSYIQALYQLNIAVNSFNKSIGTKL